MVKTTDDLLGLLFGAISKSDCIKMARELVAQEFPYNTSWQPIVDGKFNNYEFDEGFEHLAKKFETELRQTIELLYIMETRTSLEELFEMLSANGLYLDEVVEEIIKSGYCGTGFGHISVLGHLVSGGRKLNMFLDNDSYIVNAIILHYMMTHYKNLKRFNVFESPICINVTKVGAKRVATMLGSGTVEDPNDYPGRLLFHYYNRICKDVKTYNDYIGTVSEARREEYYLITMSLVLLPYVKYLRKCATKSEKADKTKISKLEKKLEASLNNVKIKVINGEEIEAVKQEVKQLEEENDKLYALLDEYSSSIANLQSRVETAESILNTYRKQDKDSYEEHEIEALIETEEIDLGKFNICVIADEDFKDKYPFFVYDYIRAPMRIDLLLRYDIVVLAVPTIKHKHSIAVVDYCKKHSIEFMYTTSTNSEKIVDSIKSYVRLKGLT